MGDRVDLIGRGAPAPEQKRRQTSAYVVFPLVRNREVAKPSVSVQTVKLPRLLGWFANQHTLPGVPNSGTVPLREKRQRDTDTGRDQRCEQFFDGTEYSRHDLSVRILG